MRSYTCTALTVASLIVSSFLPMVASAQAAPDSCRQLSTMRQNYSQMNKVLAGETAKSATLARQKDKFDAEETGCFGDWGTNLGLGLPGLADAFFDKLGSAACSAMDDYINSQLGALSSSISGPLDLVGVDFEFGGDSPFSVDTTERDIGLDADSIVNDVMSRAPETGIEGINRDVGNTGGRDLGDIYLNQGRGQSIPTPNWNPAAGGRGQ